MGNPQLKQIDGIVYVDAKGYYEYPYYKKMEIANAITEINGHNLQKPRLWPLTAAGINPHTLISDLYPLHHWSVNFTTYL